MNHIKFQAKALTYEPVFALVDQGIVQTFHSKHMNI